MKKQLILFVLVLAVIAFCAFTCGGSSNNNPPPPPPPGGFTIDTVIDTSSPFGVWYEPGVTVEGYWLADLQPSPAGDQYTLYPTSTGFYGILYFAGGRFPAKWYFREDTGICAWLCTTVFATSSPVTLYCHIVPPQYPVLLGYTISPTEFDTDNPPATATISGGAGAFDPTHGMPLVQYYDADGTLQGQAYATSVASDGSSLTGPVPDFSSAPSGTYTGVVLNQAQDSSYYLVGAVTVDVVADDPPPDPPPGCTKNECPNQN